MGQPPSHEELLEDLDTYEGRYSRQQRERAALANSILVAGEKWGEVACALFKGIDDVEPEITNDLIRPENLRELLKEYAKATADLAKLREFLHKAGRAVE